MKKMVDFDTFSKSDFRAVKIKACEAVTEVQEASYSSHLDDGTDVRSHDFKRYSRVLRAGRTGWKDSNRNRKPAAEKDDGN